MYPEDRVIVGIINRKRDFIHVRDDHWYRIPQNQMPKGIYTDYLAFFLSGKVFKEQSGGIHYFARVRGIELVRRYDILPEEMDHARANDIYYRISLNTLQAKSPPILNPTKRAIAFIYTTWDRFISATKISDLYTKSEHYVDRIYQTLRDNGITAQQILNAYSITGLHIVCKNGTVNASISPKNDETHLNPEEPEDKILAQLYTKINELGGSVTVNIPLRGNL